MASEIVKQRAREIDPGCWVSYSGERIDFKRHMEARRVEALRKATAELNGSVDTRPAFEIWWESYDSGDELDLKQIARDAWDAGAAS